MRTLREQQDWRTFLLKEAKQPLVNADPVKDRVAAAIATASTKTILEPEVEPSLDISTRASTGIPRIATVSVRDRTSRAAALAKPDIVLTPAQIAAKQNADDWLALHQRYQDETAESERRKQRALEDRANAARAAEAKRQRQGQFKFQEGLREDIFTRHAATNEQRRIVNETLAASGKFDDLDLLEATLLRIQIEGG